MKDSSTTTSIDSFFRRSFSNSLVFAKVMKDNASICQQIVERILERSVDHIEMIEVESEETTVKSHGVRFDVYLKTKGDIIEVEMQTAGRLDPKRARYYHAWIDRRSLPKGTPYSELPRAYVIFICNFDPVGAGAPVYDIEACWKARDKEGLQPYDDDSHTILLNAKGDLTRTTPEIAKLLEYIATGNDKGGDTLVTDIKHAIDKAYEDEEWVSDVLSPFEMDMLILEKEMKEELTEEITERSMAEGMAEGMEKGMAEGMEKGMAEGMAKGIAEGRKEGSVAERAREAALLDAMNKQGRDTSEFINAVMQGNLDTLYQQYGIE